MGFHRKKQKKNIQNKYSIIFGFYNFILEGTKTISGNMFIPSNCHWAIGLIKDYTKKHCKTAKLVVALKLQRFAVQTKPDIITSVLIICAV